MLCENRAAYIRALNLYAYLTVEVSRDIPLHFSWWVLPALSEAQNAMAARRTIANADLVIVSGQPATDWPEYFKRWLESWAFPPQKRLSALGALFSPPRTDTDAICGRQIYLQHLANKLKVDFLTATEEQPVRIRKLTATPPQPQNASPHDFPSPQVADHPAYSPYCGING